MIHYGARTSSRIAFIGVLFAALLISGCGTDPQFGGGASRIGQNEPTAAELLQEKLSSGAYQANAAADTIETTVSALDDLEKLASGPLNEGVRETKDLTISAGKTLSELTAEPPLVSAVEADFSAYDEQRLSAIKEANDALQDLREAHGILESLIGEAPSAARAAIDESLSFLAACMDDTIGAIEQFGGQVEEEPEAFAEPLLLAITPPSQTNIGAKSRAGA